MSSQPIPEIDELKLIYQEIIEGCSYISDGYFVKHLCELEQIELTRKRIEFVQSYIKQGVPTEQERLIYLKENDEWGNQQEEDIKAYRQTIADTEKTLSSVIIQQQQSIKQIIESHKKELIRLLYRRREAIGTTAETLAEQDGTYFLAFLSLYKDRECNSRLFDTWEDFELLDDIDSQKYIRNIDITLERINEKNIKKIGCLPFFLNPFSYCKEAIHTFLNKPIYKLTNYQVHLFSTGSRNLNILAQSEASPPDYFDKVTIDEILKWYDTQYSVIIGKRNK